MFQLISAFGAFIAGWLLGTRRVPIPHDESKEMNTELATRLDRAAELVAQLEPVLEEMSAVNTSASGLRESVAALDKQLGRVGREQFKVNALNETQQQQIQTALDQLRELNARRDADLALLRDQLRTDQSAQRLLIIQRLLPALDGLDEAIASGQRLRARPSHSDAVKAPVLTFPQRLAIAVGRSEIPITRVDGVAEGYAAWAAWLAGIELVRERLLHVLASEGVVPMPARGESFDPHRHIAVETIPASDEQAAGTIVNEYRRGYQVGEHILRAAEVVVAREVSE